MNETIFFLFYNLTHQSNFFDQVVVFFADIFPYIVIIFAFIFLLFHHEIFSVENPLKALLQKWREFFLIFFSGFFAWILGYFLKFLFHTERPFVIFQNVQNLFPESGYAFPSGHATFFMAIAVALFFYHKKIGYLFMIFALFIGIARIIAGVHFPIDIIGGYVLGFGIAFLLKNV